MDVKRDMAGAVSQQLEKKKGGKESHRNPVGRRRGREEGDLALRRKVEGYKTERDGLSSGTFSECSHSDMDMKTILCYASTSHF